MRSDSIHRSPSPRSARLAATLLATVFAASSVHAQFGAIGLSAVGGRRFANEHLGTFQPQTGDHFGWSFATGDFNGDGADDLATGIPDDNGHFGSEISNCGAVAVRYGASGSGFPAGVADTLLSPTTAGSLDPAEFGDGFGHSLAACDFDADGFDDLAVGVPFENDASNANSGAVEIFYGSSAGLFGVATQRFTQDTSGVPESGEPGDRFGFSLACGDFANDGFDDLAIGIPEETVPNSSGVGSGALVALRGSPGGLATDEAVLFHQDSAGMLDGSESFDFFAWTSAAGDFNGDGFADLAIGVPGEDNLNSDDGRGAVQVVFGSAGGLTSAGNLFRTESALGGNSELGDHFGIAIAAGDFDGDGFDDLAIGAPNEDISLAVDAGQVVAIHGSASGFAFGRTQFWFQDLIHSVGSSEADDEFGYALASGDFDLDGFDDLAIGSPGEFQLVPEDGGVSVVMGSAGGIAAARRGGLTAGYDGDPGVINQAFRNYGAALASGDFDGDGYADLAIGAPNENEGGLDEVGAAVVFYGSLFSDGFGAQHTAFWSVSVP